MDRNSVEPEIETKEMFYGAMEGVVVDGITAVEQRAVDIEEISVGCTPIETGTYIDSLVSRGGRVRCASATGPARL